jgi:hypothetical protein
VKLGVNPPSPLAMHRCIVDYGHVGPPRDLDRLHNIEPKWQLIRHRVKVAPHTLIAAVPVSQAFRESSHKRLRLDETRGVRVENQHTRVRREEGQAVVYSQRRVLQEGHRGRRHVCEDIDVAHDNHVEVEDDDTIVLRQPEREQLVERRQVPVVRPARRVDVVANNHPDVKIRSCPTELLHIRARRKQCDRQARADGAQREHHAHKQEEVG